MDKICNRPWNNFNNNYSTWNYRKLNKNCFRYSAGVLPYTFDQNGKCLFMLGKDLDGDWSDFGGRSELTDKNEPLNTASREFYEETLGSIMNIQECLDKIKNDNVVKIVSKTLNGSPYYMYLVYIDYINYTDTFLKMSNFIKYSFSYEKKNKILEKTSIRWVSMDTLINCIENNDNRLISLRGIFLKTIINCRDQLQFLQQT